MVTPETPMAAFSVLIRITAKLVFCLRYALLGGLRRRSGGGALARVRPAPPRGCADGCDLRYGLAEGMPPHRGAMAGE